MRPLLLTKETEREHGANYPKKLFHYDYHTDMNMLNGRPFIEAGSLRNRELFSKTEAQRERDDEELGYCLEMMTKTMFLGLPHRNVHDEDLTYLNDTIIPQYTDACHWNTGEIKYGERSRFMVDVVGFLYKLLQKEVASMSPQHLVERIYSDIESNTFKLLQLSSIYKYEVACYPQKQTKFLDQYNELNRSLISQKFLIEYVASCPPNGKKVFDTLDYEWILSICSAIIEYAYYGDLFKYDIFRERYIIGVFGMA